MTARRPLASPSPLTQPYWDAAAAGRFLLQRCAGCGRRPFPPRRSCPDCGHPDLDWEDASGRGTVWTFTVARRPPAAAFADEVPLVVAVVELDEGPRLTTNIVHCESDDVFIGMPVRVTFLPVADSDRRLPVFEPRPEGSA